MKFLQALGSIIFLLLFSHLLSGQNIQNIINKNLDEIGVKYEDAQNIFITDQHTSKRSKVQHTYVIQHVNGVPIVGARMTLSVDQNGVLVHSANGFIEDVASYDAPFDQNISESSAIGFVATHLGIDYLNDAAHIQNQGSDKIFTSNSISDEENIKTRMVYYPTKNKLVLAYEVDIYAQARSEWWQIIVNASNGEILKEIPWTISCDWGHGDDCENISDHECSQGHHDHNHSDLKPSSYKSSNMVANGYEVFAMPLSDPDDGGRTIETAPWNDAPNASPYGWHDTNGSNGAEYTICRGNNVWACEDRNANNVCGFSPDGGSSLDFLYPLDLSTEVPVDYQDAAITNLFYWNNIIHDVWYQYGFDESSGNFQSNNYGNGGSQNDYVRADAQDGSGTNNANMSTPTDGSRPRMQMFEWNVSNNINFEVNSPPGIAGTYSVTGANFGPSTGITTEDCIEAVPIEACSGLTNSGSVNGKIAIVDRGNCTFVTKVQNAQNAGAVGVIVCQNTGGAPITMGGSSGSINIPSVMLSMQDCDLIKAELPGVNVTIDLSPPTILDSDLDNTVIVHEYGHGISIRLTGGPNTSSCLNNSEQMGEGWSDWFGLVMSMKTGDQGTDNRGMGAYLTGEAPTSNGIRTHPYTTDLNENPDTYNDISGQGVHRVGSVWCAMLWDMTWALIDEHGFDPDMYNGTGGNNIAMELVIEGLKMQGCSPGFIDGRDAIIAADQALNGGDNVCLIWEAFAKRGLGFSASQGSSNSTTDGSEGYDIPTSCTEFLILEHTGPSVVTADENISYDITVTNNKSTNVTNVTIKDTIPDNTDYVVGSLTNGNIVGDEITVFEPVLTPSASMNTQFSVISSMMDSSELVNHEGFDGLFPSWEAQTGQGSSPFVFNNSNPRRGQNARFVENIGEDNTQYLVSDDFTLGNDPVIVFYHSYDTEEDWDGGFVQVSNNGGSTWNDLSNSMFLQNPYNSVLGAGSNNDIGGKSAFSGNSGGYIKSVLNLSQYENNTVKIRFVFGSDDNTFEEGWYIDDISVYNGFYILNRACVTDTQGDDLCEEVLTMLLPACNDYIAYYVDNDMDGYGDRVPPLYSCTQPNGYVDNFDDCDDNDPLVNPAIPKDDCDGVDNDCDGLIDEDCGQVDCDGDIIQIPVITQDVYRAKTRIISDATIINASDIEYYAGVDICLDPGFEVEQGAEFLAEIADCNLIGPIQPEEEIEEKKE